MHFKAPPLKLRRLTTEQLDTNELKNAHFRLIRIQWLNIGNYPLDSVSLPLKN